MSTTSDRPCRKIWETCKYAWIINSFSSVIKDNGDEVEVLQISPSQYGGPSTGDQNTGQKNRLFVTFSAGQDCMCTWGLELSSAKNKESEDCINFDLYLKRPVRFDQLNHVFTKCSLQLRDSHENLIESKKSEQELLVGEKFRVATFKKSLIMAKITDDVLEVSVVIACIADTLKRFHSVDSDYAGSQLSTEFRSMLESGKFSDMLIFTEDEEIKVHRCVLSTRSPFFCEMFDHIDGEKVTGKLRITDFEPKIIRLMLQFIYTAKVDILDTSIGMELLRASDKYDLIGLKILCMDYLAWNINMSNIEEILLEAHKIQCERLKKVAKNYIIKNIKKFPKTGQFPKIESENPQLLTELFLETASMLSDALVKQQSMPSNGMGKPQSLLSRIVEKHRSMSSNGMGKPQPLQSCTVQRILPPDGFKSFDALGYIDMPPCGSWEVSRMNTYAESVPAQYRPSFPKHFKTSPQ